MRRPRRTHCPHCNAEYPADHWAKIDSIRIASVKASAAERRENGGKWGGKNMCNPIKVMELRSLGRSPKEIAEEFGVAPATVRKFIARELKKQGPISGAYDANQR